MKYGMSIMKTEKRTNVEALVFFFITKYVIISYNILLRF
jgi:hypothetical protein